MLKKDKYKAVILGAGRIGAQFDNSKSKKVLTHAHAFKKHPKIELVGFFDIKKEAAAKAAQKWGVLALANFADIEKLEPDIVSICTPDESHFELLKKVTVLKPKIVICEKPLTIDLGQAREIAELFNGLKIPVVVNFTRRFDLVVREIKNKVERGEWGRVLCASACYTKGIIHNGSHLIDLCRFIFGEVKKQKIFYSIKDYMGKDKTVAGFIEFEKCPQFHLMAGDERSYSFFEVDILFEKKRVKIIDPGFLYSIQSVVADPIYAGFKCLDNPKILKTTLDNAITNLVKEAVDYLEKKSPLTSGLLNALQTQEVCHLLLKENF